MEKQKLVEYFEEVETIQEYNGYFYSIPEAVSIVVLGSIYGLRNISQIHRWAESDKAAEFMKEEFGIEHIPCYYWLLTKGNQAALEHEIRDYVQDESLRKTMDCKSITEKSRDRIETRTAYTTADIDWLYGKEKWKNLCCIGAIKTEFERKGAKTEEWHYYYIFDRRHSITPFFHLGLL